MKKMFMILLYDYVIDKKINKLDVRTYYLCVFVFPSILLKETYFSKLVSTFSCKKIIIPLSYHNSHSKHHCPYLKSIAFAKWLQELFKRAGLWHLKPDGEVAPGTVNKTHHRCLRYLYGWTVGSFQKNIYVKKSVRMYFL